MAFSERRLYLNHASQAKVSSTGSSVKLTRVAKESARTVHFLELSFSFKEGTKKTTVKNCVPVIFQVAF
jgi:hypothetical protein